MRTLLLLATVSLLPGCDLLLDLLSTDTLIDASCAGDDTVVIDGYDLCEDYERRGAVDCEVGYRIKLDGEQVCPPPIR